MLEKKKGDMTEACYLNLQKPLRSQLFRIEGQQALRLELSSGDLIEIDSPDREQVCEVLVIDSQGNAAPQLLSDLFPVEAVEIKKQLESGGQAGSELQEQLESWNVKAAHLRNALRIPGDEGCTLQAVADVTVIFAAAGTDMLVDEHSPATEINLSLTHSLPFQEYLPEPLAEVKAEIRVPRATARTYEVKAGDWIQIIDVSGKQCSDFLAFDKAELLDGKELGLDAVATRTVIGMSNPQPGLFSRFLGTDMQAMVEVVQDTVGRHDSFLMACTPKYYEDSGYFGHISCSDNFNRALTQYGVAPRPAWPAINFFFNTGIEPCGTVFMDEPWSRAGDYVLLRANRDLICASSACPDDIDPANGWNPTDIHVRIYDSQHEFPRAIAHRISPEELPRMTKTTGFHEPISALTKQLIEYRGYWVASEYEGWGAKAEYLACRERVAMIDLSPLRKFEITGPDSEAFLQYLLTRNVRRLAIGEIAYSAICFETGGMIDDGTIFRMGEQSFRWVCGDPYTGIWMRNQAREKGYKVSVRNSTEQLHNVAVQGPQSRNLLREVIWTPECQPTMDTLAWFHFLIGRIGGPDGIPVMVSRTGYTGELGFEVWCHPNDAEAVWKAIWDEGQQYEIAPMGFDALDMLRIEAGLIFADHEFCPETNPFEAGIGFTVPLKTKEEDFIGKDAIKRQAPESRKKLVGLILDEGEPAAHGDPVYQGRFPVGVVTSATPSPLLGKQIALCRIAPEFAEKGTALEVGKLDGLQKRLSGEVTTLPFYDPERTRVRS
jgi:aminomethyltransferase